MRHPAQSRNISFGIAAASAVIALAGLLLPETILNRTAGIFMMCVGGMISAIALGVGLCHVFNMRAHTRLLTGEGLKAQWKVPPALWHEFLPYDKSMNEQNAQFPNALSLTPNPPVEGVEVILGETGLIVDGDYQSLPTRFNDSSFQAVAMYPGPPQFINMHIMMAYYTRYGIRRRYHALRFPVPAEATQAAGETVAWYVNQNNERVSQRGSLLDRHPKRVRNISLVIGLITGIGGALCYFLRNEPQIIDKNVAMGLAGVAVLLTPVALLLMGMAHAICRKQVKADAAAKASTATRPHA